MACVKHGFSDDEDGSKTGRLAFGFSVAMLFFMALPFFGGFASPLYLGGVVLLNGFMILLSWKFLQSHDRSDARKRRGIAPILAFSCVSLKRVK